MSLSCCCCLVTKLCPTLCDSMDCSTPGFPVLYYLLEFAQTLVLVLMMPSNHLILCCSLLLLPSVFPRIRVFSSELALHIKWPERWSFSFSISPSNEYSGLISFRIDWFDSLLSSELSRVFSSTTVLKHQFTSALPSLWSSSHIHTWLLERPHHWLYRPLSARWCLCFLQVWFAIPSANGSHFVRTLSYDPFVLAGPAQHGS